MRKRTFSASSSYSTPGHAMWTHHGTHCACECGHATGTRPQMTQHHKLAAAIHARAERKAANWARTAEHVAEVMGRDHAIVWADRMTVRAASTPGFMTDEDVTALAKWAVAS